MLRKKIVGISGSTKAHSSNEAILKTIAGLYEDVLEMEIYKGVDHLPIFNPDLDNENVPAEVKEFRHLIDEADGVIICTPEYVFSLPGALKNAIEWTVSTTVFSQKPAALIVASASGEKAFESLKLVMRTIEAIVPDSSTQLIRGVKGKVNKAGVVTHEGTVQELHRVVGSFIKSIKETTPEKI